MTAVRPFYSDSDQDLTSSDFSDNEDGESRRSNFNLIEDSELNIASQADGYHQSEDPSSLSAHSSNQSYLSGDENDASHELAELENEEPQGFLALDDSEIASLDRSSFVEELYATFRKVESSAEAMQMLDEAFNKI